MKKFFIFIFITLLSFPAFAQPKIRKMPFLPYLQAGGGGEAISSGSAASSSQRYTPKRKRLIAIIFEEDSWNLDEANIAKIKQAAKWINTEANGKCVLVGYTTPNIPSRIVSYRLQAVKDALADFGIDALPTMTHREQPVINPNRVEININ